MSMQQIRNNIRELIAELVIASHVADPTARTMVPLTTLPAAGPGVTPAAQGATVFSITPCLDSLGRSRIREDSRLAFYDALGEPNLTVTDVSADGGTVTIATSTLLGYTGLQHAHVAGGYLYANLTDYGPIESGAMLSLGDPVVYVTMRDKAPQTDLAPTQAGYPVYGVRVGVNRLLTRTDKTAVDPQSWADYCEKTVTAEIESIELWLAQNQTLVTDFSRAAAVKFGQLANGRLGSIRAGPIQPVPGGPYHFTAYVDLTVLGSAEKQG